jgi:hypothetical protein
LCEASLLPAAALQKQLKQAQAGNNNSMPSTIPPFGVMPLHTFLLCCLLQLCNGSEQTLASFLHSLQMRQNVCRFVC